ncbi:hypothetical protein [Brevibacterium aurantiacum]|uniref:Uncharacterized protein n=1 Tax=Brevibacterium aurantiacum TaxID=273384 RepID=A0A556CDP6_BREAU|nr:hypothetical protein [Brevibacterium aurantiacum]TSI15587.1 hypothetical protein FO013_12645 [Brevibacterium aurantiacum]
MSLKASLLVSAGIVLAGGLSVGAAADASAAPVETAPSSSVSVDASIDADVKVNLDGSVDVVVKTGTPGETVELLADGAVVGSATADADGEAHIHLDASDLLDDLLSGLLDLKVSVDGEIIGSLDLP